MSATPISVGSSATAQISYEPYEPSMHGEVLELWNSCFSGHKDVFREDIGVATSSPAGLLHVARCDGVLIGTVLGASDGHRSWIYYLCVEHGYRRRGIASRLLEIAEEQLRLNGTRQIGLLVLNRSPAAMSFYRARGYSFESVRCMCKRTGG